MISSFLAHDQGQYIFFGMFEFHFYDIVVVWFGYIIWLHFVYFGC